MTDEEKKETAIWHFERGETFARKRVEDEARYAREAQTAAQIEREVQKRLSRHEDDGEYGGGMGYSFRNPADELDDAVSRAFAALKQAQTNLDAWSEMVAYVKAKL